MKRGADANKNRFSLKSPAGIAPALYGAVWLVDIARRIAIGKCCRQALVALSAGGFSAESIVKTTPTPLTIISALS